MKRLFATLSLVALLAAGSTTAYAQALSWIDQSRDYAVGEVVGGWSVLDYKDAVDSNANGVWTTAGEMGGTTRPNNATVLWFYYNDSFAEVTLSARSTAVAFMLDGDTNDHAVSFYVDGKPVLTNFDMQALPGNVDPNWRVGTLVVSGLSDTVHTLRIQNDVNPTGLYRDDFHMYGGAAVAAVPEPESFAMLMAGLGIVGAVVRRRKA
jgi:hypothetical protein